MTALGLATPVNPRGPVASAPAPRVQPASGGMPGTIGPAQRAKMAATAKQFEAMALTELLNPMFNTVDTAHGLFGGGDAEAAWKPMMVSELAKNMAAHGGLGLARPVMEQMIRLQENAR